MLRSRMVQMYPGWYSGPTTPFRKRKKGAVDGPQRLSAAL